MAALPTAASTNPPRARLPSPFSRPVRLHLRAVVEPCRHGRSEPGMALAIAAGSDSRRQLGLTAVGGLLISQFVTLYLTPVVYTYLDALQHKAKDLPILFRRLRGRGELQEAPS